MSLITVIGAGPLGRSAVRHLVQDGHEVMVVTRSGTLLPDARSLAADVTTPGGLDSVPTSSAYIACCGFPYTVKSWQDAWPRAIETLIQRATRDEATVVIAGNLYAAARTPMPIRATHPLAPSTELGKVRAEVWYQALAAHEAGRIRAVEIRGSDYIGADTTWIPCVGRRLTDPLLQGRTATVLGDPDSPHSWSAIDDFGHLLARAAHDEEMSGRAWHVPNAEACSIRQLATTLVSIAGMERPPRLRILPTPILRMLSWFSPVMAAVRSNSYQLTAPFIADDSDTRELLGETHTPLEQTLAEIVTEYRRRCSANGLG